MRRAGFRTACLIGLAVAWLAGAGCSRDEPDPGGDAGPRGETKSSICYDCFWEYQDPAFRQELVAFYEGYRTEDPLVQTDVAYLIGRVTGDADLVCRSFRELRGLREGLVDSRRRLLADEMLAFTAAECGDDPAPYFRRASRSAGELGLDWKDRVYDEVARGSFRPQFGDTVIERHLDVPPGATIFVLGESAIRVAPGATVGVQIERTVRDWLSYQMRYDFSRAAPLAEQLLDYHEGARLRDVLAATPVSVEPLTGTLAARRGERWYAPDESGVFRFEVLPDKIQYPTTRATGDLAWLVDTHGLSSLVAGAVERELALVVGCGDYTAKVEAAYHLAGRGIHVYFPCDRFVGDLIGYVGEGVLIGSAPVRAEAGEAVIGGRPLAFRIDETIVVEDTDLTGRYQYYDAAARYFRGLARWAKLQLEFVRVAGPGESDRVIARADDLGATAIGLRVETEEDAAPVRQWLAASPAHRAVLFHTAPYPAGHRLFDEFPAQTTFGDPRPVFLAKTRD